VSIEAHHLVEPALWQRAGWLGAAYLAPEGGPPGLGFAFQDAASGIAIFKRWRGVLGPRDEDELLRVCVVEGDIPGQSPGYTIHLSVDFAAAVEKLQRTGGDGIDLDLRALTGDVAKRMPTAKASTLQAFKARVADAGEYALTPVVRDASGFAPLYEHQLIKRRLVLRQAGEIVAADDPDYPLLRAR
jgi:hypothetical protein